MTIRGKWSSEEELKIKRKVRAGLIAELDRLWPILKKEKDKEARRKKKEEANVQRNREAEDRKGS